MIDVVTLLIPRAENWRDYLPLLNLQRVSAEKFGHRHVVITEGRPSELNSYETMHAEMQPSLMHAILEGQIAYLEQWNGENPVVLVDVDCLINRSLDDAFRIEPRFHVGITTRFGSPCPINNGAMYIAARAKKKALRLFRCALEQCSEAWGGDQEAMADACAPILEGTPRLEARHGARVAFLSMKDYNNSPKVHTKVYDPKPFVKHFKGETKAWMTDYAGSYLP